MTRGQLINYITYVKKHFEFGQLSCPETNDCLRLYSWLFHCRGPREEARLESVQIGMLYWDGTVVWEGRDGKRRRGLEAIAAFERQAGQAFLREMDLELLLEA